MKKVENEIIKYWIEDGILFSEYKKPLNIEAKNIKEIIDLRHEISDKEKQYWCLNITNVKSLSKEARDYAELHGQDFLHATATIVNSHVTMFIFNIFAKIKKVEIPFRAFTSKEKAVAWLNERKK